MEKQEVVVTDINMSVGSMVVFMVKWAIATIPAMIILFNWWHSYGGTQRPVWRVALETHNKSKRLFCFAALQKIR